MKWITPERCTFDCIVGKHQSTDAVLHQLAPIVRGADTDRFDLASQASSLWAVSAGRSYHYALGQEPLQPGLKIYDAL